MNELPDQNGYFGKYGGRFVPETLMDALLDLEIQYKKVIAQNDFQNQLKQLLHDFAGRPTPLYPALRLSSELGIGNIYLKREDLCHTGAHKINNCIGQALFAKRCNKTRIVAETGAGQHGVATAAVCAKLGLNCVVYMGAHDIERQQINVRRMKFFGAEVRPVRQGSQTLKDAINEALRDWITNVETTHYLIGSVVVTASLSDDGSQFSKNHWRRSPGSASRHQSKSRAVNCVCWWRFKCDRTFPCFY